MAISQRSGRIDRTRPPTAMSLRMKKKNSVSRPAIVAAMQASFTERTIRLSSAGPADRGGSPCRARRRSAARISAPSGVLAAVGSRLVISDLLHFRTAEQAGGHEDQDDGKDREGRDILVLGGEIAGEEGLDQPDQ